MSGLQELAAIIGIAETAFRSISSLYCFLKDLEHAPKEIESLLSEAYALNGTLSALLEALASADICTRSVALRIGLPRAIERCGQACKQLETRLSRWIQVKDYSWVARVQIRRHKKEIESVVADINVAKQTTILTVVVTQLSIQLKKPISEDAKAASIHRTSIQIAEMSFRTNNSGRYNERGTTSGRFPSSTKTLVQMDGSQPNNQDAEIKDGSGGKPDSKDAERDDAISQACREAQSTVDSYRTDVRMNDTKQGDGDNNVMGAQLKGRKGDVNIDMEKTYQGAGSGNVMGLKES